MQLIRRSLLQSTQITIEKKTYLCLYLASVNFTTTGKYLLVPTKAKADTMTKIKVPQCTAFTSFYSTFVLILYVVFVAWTSTAYRNDTLMQRINLDQQYDAGVGLGVTIASMGVLSYQRIYRGSIAYVVPTARPTQYPTAAPTVTSVPTDQPSVTPTFDPTFVPSILLEPSITPSILPSVVPSIEPSFVPTSSSVPTIEPTSAVPSTAPSMIPSADPSTAPSLVHSTDPTLVPSVAPTIARRRKLQSDPDPTSQPSSLPSSQPSVVPSTIPSMVPTTQPSTEPSNSPTNVPSGQPTVVPSTQPSSQPTMPSSRPSTQPSTQPSNMPSSQPSLQPTVRPSIPSSAPSMGPSTQPSAMPVMNITSSGNENSLILYKSVTFPLLVAIVIVDHGTVKNIVWDNTCAWCSSSHCLANTVDYNDKAVNGDGENCYLNDASCAKTTSDGTKTSNALCELTVYIVWHGTDSTGTNFESAAARFSRWSAYQLGNFTSVLEHEIAST